MTDVIVTIVAVAVLTIMSVRVNRRLADQKRLPVQWSLSGSVNWIAPRLWALAFTPVLAAVVLTGVTILAATTEPRAGQENMASFATLIVAGSFIAGHALLLRLVFNSVSKGH